MIFLRVSPDLAIPRWLSVGREKDQHLHHKQLKDQHLHHKQLKDQHLHHKQLKEEQLHHKQPRNTIICTINISWINNRTQNNCN